MRLWALIAIALTQLIANELFAPNLVCRQCHPSIYEEYQTSMHANATIFKDPIHKKVWEELPFSRRGEYVCGSCHTPAANNLEELIQPNGIGPDKRNPTQNDAVACAFCHRIAHIKEGVIHNINIVSKEQRKFFGRKRPLAKSPFHDIDTTNPLFQNGNNCIGCHGHYSNEAGIEIYTSTPNLFNINCVECHMPQVDGSSNNIIDTGTHAYHGNFKNILEKNAKKFIELKLIPTQEGFSVQVVSKVPHIVLTTPLKSLYLSIDVIRGNTIVFEKGEFFVRALSDKNGQVAIPWFAHSVLADTMLQPGETRTFRYPFELRKGDKVVVIFSKVLLDYEIGKDLNGKPTIEKIKIVGKPEPLITKVYPIK